MPHTLANIYCKKLHQLGEWVELFLLKGAARRIIGCCDPLAKHSTVVKQGMYRKLLWAKIGSCLSAQESN
ncbi:MAG TPA: hypothetical protein VMW89_06405 [Desulfatiglandales bacterium]|nr:hypothetical protein [Desulfatiglandales bacterium]